MGMEHRGRGRPLHIENGEPESGGRHRLVLWIASWLVVVAAGCEGEVTTDGTPTPPPDPHDQTDPDEIIYWDALTGGESTTTFYGLTGFSDADLYLVGQEGTVWRWDGTELSLLVSLTTPEGAAPDLYAAWSFSDARGKVLYVGGTDGAIYRYDFLPGDNLTEEDFEWLETGTRSTFQALFGLDRDTLWAVGEGGIYQFDGERWIRDATAPGGVRLLDVWGRQTEDSEVLYAAGRTGTLLTRTRDPASADSAVWTPVSLGRSEDLHAIWGLEDGTVFVAGQYGLVLAFDGVNWTTMDTGVFDHLWAVWGRETTSVFAVGTGGTTIYFDGNGWQRLSAGTHRNLYGVQGMDAGTVFAVGVGGTLLSYDGDPSPPPYQPDE